MNSSSIWPITELVAVALSWVTFAVGVFVIGSRIFRPGRRERIARRDALSFYGLALEFVGLFLIWFVRRETGSPLFPMPLAVQAILAIVVSALAMSSTVFMLIAFLTLDKQLHVGAKIVEHHELIVKGPYAVVRHPIYSGLLGLGIATALALSRWEIIVPALLVFVSGTLLRIKSEERLLRPVFGKNYEDYARRVPALIPQLVRGHAAAH